MTGTNTLLGGGGLHHVALRVYDIDRSVEFYTTHLGFVEKARFNTGDGRTGVWLDTGDGNYLEIFSGAEEAPEVPGKLFHFAVRVADTHTTTERLRAAGIPITMETKTVTLNSEPPHEITISFFSGPDGESVELFQTTTS